MNGSPHGSHDAEKEQPLRPRPPFCNAGACLTDQWTAEYPEDRDGTDSQSKMNPTAGSPLDFRDIHDGRKQHELRGDEGTKADREPSLSRIPCLPLGPAASLRQNPAPVAAILVGSVGA